jgi:DNA repair protein RadB
MIAHFLSPPCGAGSSLGDCVSLSPPLHNSSWFQCAAGIPTDVFVSSGDITLDCVLGGGFRCGDITEVFGEAGSGKTQLLMQLAVSAASRGETVLWCVSEPLPHNRLAQLAAVYASRNGAASHNSVLEKIMISRVSSEEHVVGIMSPTGPASQQCSDLGVSLVLLDSIAAACTTDGRNAAGAAEHVGYCLANFARRFGVAVVVSNQVRSCLGGGDHRTVLIASMGLGWANTVRTRLFLSRPVEHHHDADDEGGTTSSHALRYRRVCQSVFSPTQAPFRTLFSIDNAGIHFYPYHDGGAM